MLMNIILMLISCLVGQFNSGGEEKQILYGSDQTTCHSIQEEEPQATTTASPFTNILSKGMCVLVAHR